MDSKENRRRRYCTGITSELYIKSGIPSTERETKRSKEEIEEQVKRFIEEDKKLIKERENKRRGRKPKEIDPKNIVFK